MLKKSFHLIGARFFMVCAVTLMLTAGVANATQTITSSLNWNDDFSDSSLDSRWSWIREVPSHWSLTANPGFMRITTQQTFSNVNNILIQNMPVGNYEIETRVLFTPTENFQIAGLVIYQDDGNYLALGRAFCGAAPPACVGNGIYFDYLKDGFLVGDNFSMTTTSPGEAYLKVVREGNTYSGYVSEDGASWTFVGAHTVTLSPTKVGLRATNQAQGASEIPADFDYFTLTDNSYKIFLPMTHK